MVDESESKPIFFILSKVFTKENRYRVSPM
jgi:hypothetical protein